MNQDTLFTGIHAVLYALFCKDETLDMQSMATQVEYCIAAGCHGITVLGLATEVQKLTYDEKVALIVDVSKTNRGRVPLSVTISGNSVAEQIELAQVAQANAADWLILQPPMVGNYGADVYLDFFARVAGAVSLPIAIQNAPQYLGRALSGEDISRLRARCANVVCVKSEESALGVQRIIDLTGDTMHIMGGRGGLEMTDSLRAGCRGFVYAPDIVPVAVKVYEAWNRGDTEQAEALYTQAVPAITFVMQSLEQFITYGKRVFALQAGLTVYDRAPVQAPNEFGLAMTTRWATHLSGLLTVRR